MLKRAMHLVVAVSFLFLGSFNFLTLLVHADAPISITSCAELQGIGVDVGKPLNGDYVLGGDIECGDTTTWDNGAGFNPIGSFADRFSGTLDGQNHTVNELYINRPSCAQNNIGLFAVIDEGATVTNLNLTNVDITGCDEVGALAGGLVGHVENINATGTVTGDGTVGGLVGQHVPVNNLNNSSPLVFTWNGQKYTYAADVGSQLPKELSGIDTAKIDNADLTPKDGKYSMRIAQEYNEIVYYDKLALTTYDHAPGYTVVKPLTRGSAEAGVRTVSETPTNQLQGCTDMYGHECTNDLRTYDDSWGYVDPSNDQCWTMDFGDLSEVKDTNVQLLMRGARDYSKTPQTKMRSISVKGADGNWTEVYNKNTLGSDGTPRLRSVDLTGKFPSNDYHVKVCLDTWQMNYFAIDTSPQVPYTEHSYHPDRAQLGYHGFTATDDSHYVKHDYDQVSDNSKEMLQTQYGNFTKYGDVKPLLSAEDDHFVVMHYGDEMQVEFPYEQAPEGTERSFILGNDVFYKHANLGAIGRTVDPMPYHGMTSFDANTQYPQTPANQAYLAEWNTRKFDGTGRTGGSTIVNSSAHVTVNGQYYNIGGMVGYNMKPIINSHAYGDVYGRYDVGGLVGANSSSGEYAGTITDSSSAGIVYGDESYGSTAGGLVGGSWGTLSITNSHSSSAVFGHSYVGGLIGSAQDATVEQSSSTGDVYSNSQEVGGLVGTSYHSAYTSDFSSSNVTADPALYVGGLVGYSDTDTYQDVYATGDVTGTGVSGYTGGLIGYATNPTIDHAYTSGHVSSWISVGGLIGNTQGTSVISNSFSASTVDIPSDGWIATRGSLVGVEVDHATYTNDFFNSDNARPCAVYEETPGTSYPFVESAECTGVSVTAHPSSFKQTSSQPINSWDLVTTWSLTDALNQGYPCLQWQDSCSVVPSDTVELTSPETGTMVALQEAGCSAIDTATTSKESGLVVQDGAYNYPLGLVNYTLSGCDSGVATVTITFVGTYDPSTITVRKYNSQTGAFTTLNGNEDLGIQDVTFFDGHALQITLNINDGGPLDEDGTVNGTIIDPIGPAQLVVSVPNTGLGHSL